MPFLQKAKRRFLHPKGENPDENFGKPHLIHRDWQESDAEDVFAFAKNQEVEQAGWSIHRGIDDSIRFIRIFQESQETWAVALREDNRAIGAVSLLDIHRNDRYREIEYVISGAYGNRGYATEAVKRVLDYAFGELHLGVVAVCHYPENMRSKRVIEKCGFTYEGTLRGYNRNLSDSVRYSMTREEWAQDPCFEAGEEI
ncbi:MAG: GNAT family N-acetyltransferase [Clostridiaceae bacterium]|nr:GNAT family N-acetyltransferase [Clostridiaceae bacterium]